MSHEKVTPESISGTKSYSRPLLKTLLVIAVLVGVLFALFKTPVIVPQLPLSKSLKTFANFKRFTSEAELKGYLAKAKDLTTGFSGIVNDSSGFAEGQISLRAPTPLNTTGNTPEITSDRVSTTNVQVKGIDEPDIVKTNGRDIFISHDSPYNIIEPMRTGIMVEDRLIAPVPPQKLSETSVIGAFPLERIAKLTGIDKTGEMLLVDRRLLIFENNIIYGFDISDVNKPREVWKIELDNRNRIVTARLNDKKVYLVTQNSIDYGNPCPVPLLQGVKSLSIPCSDIYYPQNPMPTDTTYTVLKIDPVNGTTENTISFVGKNDSSIAYMSAGKLYVTYSYTGDMYGIMYDFYKDKGSNLVLPEILQKFERLNAYDLSLNTKMTEFQSILEKYYRTLSDDERLRIQNETTNKITGYLKSRARDLERTGIVRIDLSKLNIESVGEVSGKPINQFALDEYQGNLRIATTFENSWWGWGSQTESASDVYVLSSSLEIVGAVTNLGVTERIYSVRFIKDQAYVVTFRQTDPFYVLDLSNPRNPQRTGELKIPGFSSYLHPLTDKIILGVGQEDGKVKLSLFDISNPANPTEADKYTLDEYWTEVQNNHHAFFQDDKYQVFFLPGGQGGYIFSYSGNKLSLTKAVGGEQVKRALFINDYLYILSNNEITVLDEKNWTNVKNLTF